jgi:hypothetical protein
MRVLTDKELEEIIAKIPTPKLERRKKPEPEPTAPPVLTITSDRRLSVDGQRERVSREMQELIEAEKNRQACIETNRQRMERQRAEGLYYRRLYEATATAEYWAKVRDEDPARRGEYSPIARFEREPKGSW